MKTWIEELTEKLKNKPEISRGTKQQLAFENDMRGECVQCLNIVTNFLTQKAEELRNIGNSEIGFKSVNPYCIADQIDGGKSPVNGDNSPRNRSNLGQPNRQDNRFSGY